MKYFGGCDVGSTYTKAVILDENGKMCADTTIRSKINAEQSAIAAMEEVCGKVGLRQGDAQYLYRVCPAGTGKHPNARAGRFLFPVYQRLLYAGPDAIRF